MSKIASKLVKLAVVSSTLAATVLGFLFNTSPIYAGAKLTVVIKSYGASRSAYINVNNAHTLQGGKRVTDGPGTCWTTPSRADDITLGGKGEFSVIFYKDANCKTQTHKYRFSAPNTGGPVTVTCNSDTDCKETSTPR